MRATDAELIACVEREIGMRGRAYPRFVAQKRMTQEKADRELELMRRVLARLQELTAARERPAHLPDVP